MSDSIGKGHPLSGEADFREIRRQVQWCEISWPLGVTIANEEQESDEARLDRERHNAFIHELMDDVEFPPLKNFLAKLKE